ncbi:unnamed protein product [Rotaria sordida]|uniref:Uncharacterized protein n=1 Tax=Rotaria sordida TaxID=392033 RepID=A0A814R8F1_9BILA|nr:unnamed protein product [Rotaria sordida]CAF1047190.1 unnamed protein product [Rotaria sordida]CAF1128622.1 unnamed protein product [Rotaria sordida]CAF1351386.1 unnamed protein product [Rotaria sordida]CAF3566211.1 unnamed protein product [Rotaria sordida]
MAGYSGPGNGSNQLNMPWAVYVDKNEYVCVADTDNSRIQMWAKGATRGVTVAERHDEGIIVAGTGVGGSAANQLSRSRGFVIDQRETIYIADLWNSRIKKWKKGASEGITVAGGNGQGLAANQMNSPWNVEVDPYGNIYIADTDNIRVMKWVPAATEGM